MQVFLAITHIYIMRKPIQNHIIIIFPTLVVQAFLRNPNGLLVELLNIIHLCV